jgi:FKBP-type peptidyl-prolyl cis-trans isomerase
MFIGLFKTKIKGYTQRMKHTFLVIGIAAALCVFSGCGGKFGSFSKKSSSAEDGIGKDASYALGMNVGTSMKADGIYLDMKEFVQGINDIVFDAESRYTMDEAYQVFTEAFEAMKERRKARNIQAEADFLAENSKKPGIIVTESGLQYEVITEADGPKPAYENTVQVHYEGTLVNGTVFDSSYTREEPAKFPLSGVITGWAEGLQLMSVGSKYRFYIPSDLGYGERGSGSQIPPYSTLVFEVELLDIDPQN